MTLSDTDDEATVDGEVNESGVVTVGDCAGHGEIKDKENEEQGKLTVRGLRVCSPAVVRGRLPNGALRCLNNLDPLLAVDVEAEEVGVGMGFELATWG